MSSAAENGRMLVGHHDGAMPKMACGLVPHSSGE